MELLSEILQFPISIVPGVRLGFSPPISGSENDAGDVERKATISAAYILVSRPNWARKILGAWNQLDKDSMSKAQRWALSIRLSAEILILPDAR